MKTDQVSRCFVIVRALLLSVSLAPPFYVLLAQQRSAGVTGLGLMIAASGLAASLSAPIWGRMEDRSSRLVVVVVSEAAGLTALLTLLLDSMGGPFMNSPWTYALLFMFIVVFHSWVLLDLKVYLAGMATQDTRSTYVAVSNTVIGASNAGLRYCGGVGRPFSHQRDTRVTRTVVNAGSVIHCADA
jgi:MFS family permease